MGEAADDVLNGLVCKDCGDWFHDDEEPGHPRSCCHDPLEGAPKDGRGNLFATFSMPLRWLPYSHKSEQFKRGIKGRWQIFNGYGFENADLEAIDGWVDRNAAPSEEKAALAFIAGTLEGWIRFNLEQRKNDGIETTDDTHIMAPPTWPSHGQLREWVKVLKKAAGVVDG